MADEENVTEEAPEGDEAKAADDGVVTSATSSVGSLLSDLLSEAQREVEKERVELQTQVDERDQEERKAKQEAEAKRREENTRRVIEETRRRNENFAKKERAALGLDQPRPPSPATENLDGRVAAAPPAKAGKGLVIGFGLACVGVLILGFLFMDTRGQLEQTTETSTKQAAEIKTLTATKTKLQNEHAEALLKVRKQGKEISALKVASEKSAKLLEALKGQLKKAETDLAATNKRLTTALAGGGGKAKASGPRKKRRPRKKKGGSWGKGF